MRWAIFGLLLVACASRPPMTPRDDDEGVETVRLEPEPPGPESVRRDGLPTPDPANHRADDLLHDAALVGQVVTVDLVESIWDHEHSTAAPQGGYEVTVADTAPYRVRLRRATRAERDRDGELLARLPRHLDPPVRVVGRVAKSEDGVDLVPRSISLLSFPEPVRLPQTEDLVREPAKWSHRYVEVETTYLVGFEASYIGEGVWLDAYPTARVRCPPPSRRSRGPDLTRDRHQLRVRGYAYTRGGYGHLGAFDAMIDATEIVYLDPSRPACR